MSFKIDVPGIGQVVVDGAAEERTMQDILNALKDMKQNKKKENLDVKQVNKDLKDFSDALKDTSKDIDELGDAADRTSQGLTDFGKSLAKTAANIAVSFVKSYDQMAEQPIQAGAALVQASIDLRAQIAKIGVDALAAGVTGVAALFGPLGESTQNAAEATSRWGKEVIELGQAIATVGNQILAAEFEKRVKSMQEFAKAGASFTGGMTEIGQLSKETGIGLYNFSKMVANSRDAITNMGLSAGEASKILARGVGGLGKTFNAARVSVRDQLLALGVGYEEQGEVMALFMQQQARAGKNLENLATAELVEGTKQYAKNLKVISDITGQDAKKLAERAQAESLRGALAGKLNKQQNEAFQGAFMGIAKIGPEMAPKLQLALTQLLTGNAVRDPAIAANTEIMDMLKQTASMVMQGQQDQEGAFSDTYDNLIKASKLIKASGQDAVDVANVYQTGGLPADIANLRNSFRVMQGEVGEAGKSFTAAKGQMSDTGDLTKGYQQVTGAMANFQNKMEALTSDALIPYATMIGETTERTAKVMGAAIDYLSGKIGLTELGDQFFGAGSGNFTQKQAEVEQKTKTAEQNLKEAYKKTGDNTMLGRFTSNTPEQQKARRELSEAEKAQDKYMEAKRAYDVGLARVKSRVQAEADEKAYGWRAAFGLKGGAPVDPQVLRKEIEDYNKRFATPNSLAPDDKNPEYAKILGIGMAKGGISKGPVSGYNQVLHGTEAVVPLEDNRSIPVSLDSSSLTSAMTAQTRLLNDILTAMHRNNNLTSGILQASA